MHRSESVLRLGFPSQNVRKFLKKKTYTHAELARPFFLGTGSQTVIWVRFPLGIRAGWLSHPRLLANGNRKFIMTRLLIKFASSFCCSHRRLGQLVVSRFANNTQNVPAQQIYTNRAYFLLFYKQPGLLINRNWRTLWNWLHICFDWMDVKFILAGSWKSRNIPGFAAKAKKMGGRGGPGWGKILFCSASCCCCHGFWCLERGDGDLPAEEKGGEEQGRMERALRGRSRW